MASKKWTQYDEDRADRLRAEIEFAKANLAVCDAAKAAGESASHFLTVRRKPFFKIMKELDKTVRLLQKKEQFEAIESYKDYDEYDLTRMERQPLNFDPHYLIGWSVYECPVGDGAVLCVCFGIEKDQQDETLRYSIELLGTPEEGATNGRRLLKDIDGKKYTHAALAKDVLARLAQFEPAVEETPRAKGRPPRPESVSRKESRIAAQNRAAI